MTLLGSVSAGRGPRPRCDRCVWPHLTADRRSQSAPRIGQPPAGATLAVSLDGFVFCQIASRDDMSMAVRIRWKGGEQLWWRRLLWPIGGCAGCARPRLGARAAVMVRAPIVALVAVWMASGWLTVW